MKMYMKAVPTACNLPISLHQDEKS